VGEQLVHRPAPLPWREVSRPAWQDLHIAWASRFPNTPIEKEIQTAIEQLANQLDRLGAHVKQVWPTVDLVEQSRWSERFFEIIVGSFKPQPSSLRDYFEALHRREAFVYAWEQFLSEWDVFLCPAYHRTARRHDESVGAIDASVSAESLSGTTGQPALVIPIAKGRNGLPIGIQVIARRWDDERLLAIAELIVEVTGGFQRPPGY